MITIKSNSDIKHNHCYDTDLNSIKINVAITIKRWWLLHKGYF